MLPLPLLLPLLSWHTAGTARSLAGVGLEAQVGGYVAAHLQAVAKKARSSRDEAGGAAGSVRCTTRLGVACPAARHEPGGSAMQQAVVTAGGGGRRTLGVAVAVRARKGTSGSASLSLYR